MTRDDQIRATVAARMQDSGVIREAIENAIRAAFREGGEPGLIADIAHCVAEAALDDRPLRKQELAFRLFMSMDAYVYSVLTARANDDLPQPDDEENDDD